jgi:hypothetical protein
MIAKKALTLIVPIFVWLFWASHCIVSDAFALGGSSREHSPCHSDGDDGSPTADPEKQIHHDECQKKGCCQAFLTAKTVDGPSLELMTLNDSQRTLSLLAHLSLIAPSPQPLLTFSLAPPDDWLRPHDLVTSLVTAPNAPPALLFA